MHHKLFFSHYRKADAISATANMDGFTVLNAIKMHFGWDTEMLREAAEQCNKRGEIAVLKDLTPRLLLVPRTKVQSAERTKFYIEDLLKAADAIKVLGLQFTHYSFTNRISFDEELIEIFRVLFSPALETGIDLLVFDIDYRCTEKLKQLMTEVRYGKYGMSFDNVTGL